MSKNEAGSSIESKSARDLGSDDFLTTHFFGSRPVIVRDAMADWGALGKWGPEYFMKLYGGRQLQVASN